MDAMLTSQTVSKPPRRAFDARLGLLCAGLFCAVGALGGCSTTASAAGDAVARTEASQRPDVSAAQAAAPSVAAVPAGVSPEAREAMTEVDEAAGFKRWIGEFRSYALERGIAPGVFDATFAEARFQPRVLELDRSQPEFTRAVWDYLDSAVSDTRVQRGRQMLTEHRATLEAAEARYGVPAEVIVAIWGMESNYGANFGSFSTIDSLATLGYEGRRSSWARGELISALRIIQAGDIDRAHMVGSWAGAMGHTQFMPSSFLEYAVDGDGDGHRDIWGSIPDVVASTANYLARNGWRAGQPWGAEVRLPAGFDYAVADMAERRATEAWQGLGVTALEGETLPAFDQASVLLPAGARGPAFLVGPNFRAIMRYNNSTSYALGVALLSQRLSGGAGVQGDWPRDLVMLSRTQVRELQTLLGQRGFDAGTPDGVIGPATRGAMRAFQRSQGLPGDGFPTLTLLERLRGQ